MKPQRDAPDEMDVYVGAQLKLLRKQARVTQAGLADALGVTFQQIQKYEKGANRMAASTLARASVALGCSVMDFYPSSGPTPVESRADALAELAGHYDRMGEMQKQALLQTARALADAATR